MKYFSWRVVENFFASKLLTHASAMCCKWHHQHLPGLTPDSNKARIPRATAVRSHVRIPCRAPFRLMGWDKGIPCTIYWIWCAITREGSAHLPLRPPATPRKSDNPMWKLRYHSSWFSLSPNVWRYLFQPALAMNLQIWMFWQWVCLWMKLK